MPKSVGEGGPLETLSPSFKFSLPSPSVNTISPSPSCQHSLLWCCPAYIATAMKTTEPETHIDTKEMSEDQQTERQIRKEGDE
mmetsp:Transcript_37000/g.72776  ORF Transcript_37000/g.72776 Transcript_37000/m.72776 type:complete len:83 (-) Transcript_37000:1279-1527(-)